MSHPNPNPNPKPKPKPHRRPAPTPPGEPAWDIRFTRLAQAVQPRLDACAITLACRYQAIGLSCEVQVRQTPRGLSTFLAMVGQRGLIGVLDMTLVDGMLTGQGPHVALDIRVLDACGEVVAGGPVQGCTALTVLSAPGLIELHLERAATAIYVATLAHFDLLQAVTRHA